MEPFATSHELEARLQATFTAGQHTAADDALRRASDTFRELAGQTIFPVQTDVTKVWYGVSASRLFLPHPPVVPVQVGTVTVNGDVLDPAEWRVEESHSLVRVSGSWQGDVEVVYQHGFASPPQSVAGVVLSLVARTFDNPSGLTQETAGPFNRSFGNAAVQGWRAEDLRVLDLFRKVAFL